MTATALILLYVIAGLLIAGSRGFELERFIIRAGNLLILSLLLIWFGIHQSRTNLFFAVEEGDVGLDQRSNPLAVALTFAMRLSGAGAGVLIVGDAGEEPSDGFQLLGDSRPGLHNRPAIVRSSVHAALLFDIVADRALTRTSDGRFQFFRASDVLNIDQARNFGLPTGSRGGSRYGHSAGVAGSVAYSRPVG